jgi:cbb3-type cytochrome oxidase subunit 3
MSEEWAALYKFARLALLAIALGAIALWLFRPAARERLEQPARRMLEEDER